VSSPSRWCAQWAGWRAWISRPGGSPLARPLPRPADLTVFVGNDARTARDAEIGLRAVPAGSASLVRAECALMTIEPRGVLLSALKPAEDGVGIILRVLNPTDAPLEARLRIGFPFARIESVELDERPAAAPLVVHQNLVSLSVPAHALQSLRLVSS
jgi:hypothetical protein